MLGRVKKTRREDQFHTGLFCVAQDTIGGCRFEPVRVSHDLLRNRYERSFSRESSLAVADCSPAMRVTMLRLRRDPATAINPEPGSNQLCLAAGPTP